MYRPSNVCDRPCDECKSPMVGIMRKSDRNGFSSPRKICYKCYSKKNESEKNGRRKE